MNTQLLLLHRFFVIVSFILIASVSILSAQTEMTLTPVKDNTAENFGWILVGSESSLASAKRFDSRENGTENNRPELTVAYTEPTGVISSSEGIIPEEFVLRQNYPNPFNPSTLIRYTLPQSVNNMNIQTELFNLTGQKVSLMNGPKLAGTYSVRWDGRDDSGKLLSGGVYLYRLKAGPFVNMKRMVLLR